jgi:hypothetical protein
MRTMERPFTLREKWSALWDRVRGRDYRNFLLRTLPPGSAGCEIGVWEGDFSAEILRTVRPRRLVLIDPWLYQPEFAGAWYGGALLKSQAEMDSVYERVRERFSQRPEVQLLRGRTREVQSAVAPASLDWIYIDGNHDYDHVRLDLDFAAQVVKPGGLVLGDDFGRGPPGQIPPVTRALSDHLHNPDAGLKMLWTCRHQFCLQRQAGKQP